MTTRHCLTTLLASALLLVAADRSPGETVLQLYIEGATYDAVTESWTKTVASDGGDALRLWAIGNTGAVLGNTIHDVKLAIAYSQLERTGYDAGDETPTSDNGLTPDSDLFFSLAGSTTGNYGGFTDPAEPPVSNMTTGDWGELGVAPDADVPGFFGFGLEGTVPVLGDGRPLPAHGEYGPGVVWQEFLLGDFDQVDSYIADFNGDLEIPVPTGKMGQISVYEVQVSRAERDENGNLTPLDENLHGVELHFDLYNHVEGKNKAKIVFAPFSHDADGTTTYIPAPSALVGLLSMGLVGLAGALWRRRKKA